LLVRIGTVTVAALALTAVSAVMSTGQSSGSPPTADATGDSFPGTAEDSHQITFVGHRAYWSDILASDLGVADGIAQPRLPGVLIVSGEIRNASERAVHHVQLAVELLAGDAVVVRESGHNLAAEALDAASNPNAQTDTVPAVVPMPPGGTDRFRMLFLREELPRFDRYRIRVLAAPPAAP
jgi:hypothetical protein